MDATTAKRLHWQSFWLNHRTSSKSAFALSRYLKSWIAEVRETREHLAQIAKEERENAEYRAWLAEDDGEDYTPLEIYPSCELDDEYYASYFRLKALEAEFARDREESLALAKKILKN